MKILFVAMEDSFHTYRWVSKLQGNDTKLFLFSSHSRKGTGNQFSKKKDEVVIFQNDIGLFGRILLSLILLGRSVLAGTPIRKLPAIRKSLGRQRLREIKQKLKLIILIKIIKPDIIHTLHTQSAGYLVADVKRRMKGGFPVWIHSVWGSDLYFWGRFPAEHRKLESLLEGIDYFWGEGDRDYMLAKSMGYMGVCLPCIPAGGGLEIENLSTHGFVPPSARKALIVKGYQYLFGRFFVALRALERSVDLLKDYRIYVFAADGDSRLLCELFELKYGIKMEIITGLSDERMLEMFAQSRVYLGLSISDGLPSSLLEALAGGAFPIQSNTAITEGLIEDGVNGILTGPDDPEEVESALRLALTDDELVDRAAVRNRSLIKEKFGAKEFGQKIREAYRISLNGGPRWRKDV